MSMLTGEPRSATVLAVTDAVVLEIDKSAFGGLLEKRPEIARQISRVIAERREAMIARGKVPAEFPVLSKESFADHILKRMNDSFGIPRHSIVATPSAPPADHDAPQSRQR